MLLLLDKKMTTLIKQELKHRAAYIPAFNRSFLTPFYDSVMKYGARESAFKPELVEQAKIEKGQRVLDLGCGTATLTILIKEKASEAEVIGLDGDRRILEIAKAKIEKTGLDIALDFGTVTELPYPDDYFDRVVCSMVLHHLTLEDKLRSLRQAFRILKPQGELHLADFGKPHGTLMRLPSLLLGRLERASDNLKGLLPELISVAGFHNVRETANHMTLFGTITLYKAKKSQSISIKEVAN